MRVPHRCLEVCREISDDYERLNMILTVWFEGFALQSWWFAVARCWKVDPSFCCCRCRCVFFAVSCVQTDINTIWGKLQVSSLVSMRPLYWHSGSLDPEGFWQRKSNAVPSAKKKKKLNLPQLSLQRHLTTHYVGQSNVQVYIPDRLTRLSRFHCSLARWKITFLSSRWELISFKILPNV